MRSTGRCAFVSSPQTRTAPRKSARHYGGGASAPLVKWLNVDPARERGSGPNLTAYGAANPAMRTDWLGLQPQIDLIPTTPEDHRAANEAVESVPGYFVVAAHGNAYELFGPNKESILPGDLARMIKAHPDYKPGMTIVLVSCETGKAADGYAQQLSIFMGDKVVAPDKVIWVYRNGNLEITGENPPAPGQEHGTKNRNDPGRFVMFAPN